MMATFSSIYFLVIMAMAMKIFLNFKNKIMNLVLMELMFIMTILNQVNSKSSSYSILIALIMTMFMVLDSTMGISILMSSSRNSYLSMQQFQNI